MKKKCLIYVVCYNHEKFILKTLERIPQILSEYYDIEILVANDKSKDKTLEETKKFVTKHFKYNVISLYKNLGYGGNQKIGYYYSILNNFDYVVLLHGDGQYAPEYLPDILNKFEEKEKISAVFGSRMLELWWIYAPMPISFVLVAIEFIRFLVGIDDMFGSRTDVKEGM